MAAELGNEGTPFEAQPPTTHPLRPLQAGQVIDGYRLDKHLHQGGMAQLWQVTAVDGG